MFVLSIFLRRYRLDVSCGSWILSGHAWFTCFFSCYTRICRWIASTADLWFYAVLSRAVLVRQVVTWERLATTWKGFFIFSRCITDSNGFQRIPTVIHTYVYTIRVYIYIHTSVATRTFWQLRISQGRMQNRWELLDDNTVESCVRITQLSEAWSKKGLKADRKSGTNTWQTSMKETQAIELCIFFIISTFQELLTPGSGRFHDLKSMEAWPLYRFVWNPFLLTKWCKKGEQCRGFRGESYPITKAGSHGGLKSFRRFAKFVIFFCVFFVQQKPQNWRRCLRSWRIPFRSFLIMWVSMRSFLMRCHWKSHPMVFTESIQSTHSSVIVIPSCEHVSCHLHTSYCRTFTNQDEGKRAILSILSAVWFLKASDLTISMIWRCFVDNKKRLLGFHLL